MSTHIIIPTHTTRHLRLALLGAALQGPAAASVTVSIDNDDPTVRDLARACAVEFNLPLTLVWRPYPGEVRIGQVRNNGVRALLTSPDNAAPRPDDLIFFIDGDCVAPPDTLARAASLGQRHSADLLIGGRICLTPAQTERFDEPRLRRAEEPAEITSEQRREVLARDQRYRWHLRLKPFGLVKPHKPKVLGASHACTLALFQRINGYDESFLGASEDDDFGRRAHVGGARVCVAVADLCVYHLYHPFNPRKRENWSDLDAAAQYSPECVQGLDSPRPQPDLTIAHIGPSSAAREESMPLTQAPRVPVSQALAPVHRAAP